MKHKRGRIKKRLLYKKRDKFTYFTYADLGNLSCTRLSDVMYN